MAIGKRGKTKLGVQLRDDDGKAVWVKDGNGRTLLFPDTKQGREDAKLVERELILARDKRKRQGDPGLLRSGQVPVEDYFDRWKRVYPRAKKSSNIQYASAVAHFVKQFEGRAMASVERFEAVDYGAANPWRISAVRAMFSDAQNEGVVETNVFAKLPGEAARVANGGTRRRKPRESMIVLTPDELDRLIECVYEEFDADYAPIYATRVIVAAYSGLRPGELDALTAADIDFKRKRIRIHEQWSSHSREYTTPKGRKPGQRGGPTEVGLLEQAEEALKKLPAYIKAYFGKEGPETDRLFPTIKGKAFTARTRGWYWDPVRERFGKPEMDFYELRHFCATYLFVDLGLPSYVVAAQLQHKDNGRLVEQTYGKPQHQAALDALVAGTRTTKREIKTKGSKTQIRRRAAG